MDKKELIDIIVEASKKRLTTLDLHGKGIQNLPSEITQLDCLEILNLSDNALSELPTEIGNLSKLHRLDLNNNRLMKLPTEISQLADLRILSLESNYLTNLPSEFFERLKLWELNLSNNSFKELPPQIKHLINLQALYLNNCQLEILPSEIGNLMSLQVLSVARNNLSFLPVNIGNLPSLKDIDFSENVLTTLPLEITQLVGLKTLNLRNNKLRALPRKFEKFLLLELLDLRDNSLDIPLEILAKIDQPNIQINYYSQYFAGQRKALNEAKMLIVGQGSVGKTSIVKQLINKKFDPSENKTDGIAIIPVRINIHNEQTWLNIWDFGGQEIMHATHQFFLTKRSIYLLVIDARLTQEENRVEYWLKTILSFGGDSPIIIVGNKIDQHPLDIDSTGLMKKYPAIKCIVKTSAASGDGIGELRDFIAQEMSLLPHVHDQLLLSWFSVKLSLEKLERDFITYEEYLSICEQKGVNDEISQRTLIGFLHDLGVVLHFYEDTRLASLGILNPQWVTNGVYKILNSHTLFQNKGVLTTSMLDEILNLPEYPRGKRLFIVDMMKRFELCYDIEPDKTFLVPDLLPKDEPAELKFNGVPAFEYAYPVLPSSVITRFIVRMNQKIDDGLVWRTGVVLKIGENKALVKADIEDRKITIAIDGLEHTRRDALSAIRYQLDEIHGSIKGLDAQKRVPIPEAPNAEPLDYDYLLQLERDGELEILPVKDGSRLVKVNVRKLLSGVVSETERRQSTGNTTNIYVGGDVGGNIVTGDENEVKK